MKKRFVSAIILLILILPVIPFSASAEGGYVASKKSKVYHVPDCYHVNDIKGSNLIWWHNISEVNSTGRRPCSHCRPDLYGSNFEYGTTYAWYSSDPRIQIGYEQEYAGGYDDGYDDGFQFGKNSGYTNGYLSGKTDGKDEGYDEAATYYMAEIESLNETHEKELRESQSKIPWGWILSSAVIAFLIGAQITANKKEIEINKLKDQHEAMNVVEIIAAESGTTASELLNRVYINYRAIDGVPEETAKAELRNRKLSNNSLH